MVQKLKIERNALEQRSRELRSQQAQCEQAIVRHQRDRNQIRIRSQQAQTEFEELQDLLEQNQVEEGKLDSLQNQLKEAEDEESTYAGSYQDFVTEKDKIYENVKQTRAQMAEMDKSIEEAQNGVRRAEIKAAELADKRETALRDKNTAHEQVTRMKLRQAQHEQARDEEIERTEDYLRQANEICARVAVDEGETGESLEVKIHKLEKDLENAERR